MRTAAALVLALLLPTAGLAQSLAIEHSSIGCVVAGQHPVFNACFTPASELARARVYFKAEGSPHWYFVEMKSDAPCFTGTLPKPKKEIGGLSYYVEATDRSFNAARTDETPTRVVGNALECKDKLAAPFVDKASVVVGGLPGAPIVPLGFATSGIVGAGGLSTAALAGIVGGGAAAAGGAVALNNNNGTTTTTTPATTTPATTTPPPPPTTTPPPTTPPTTTPSVNNLPTINVRYSPNDRPSPMEVAFNLCNSTDPDGDDLRYKFDFENTGTFDESGASCTARHTYTGDGATFTARLCINDRVAGHPDVCQTVPVRLTSTNTCTPGDESGPTIEWLEPNQYSSGFASASNTNRLLKVDASDPSGVAYVEFYAYQGCEGGPGKLSTDTTGSPFSYNWNAPDDCSYYCLEAVAFDGCGNSSSDSNYLYTSCTEALVTPTAVITWTSDLDVAGASSQLVLNGSNAFFPGRGKANGQATVRAGENRLEGQLVAASGTPGTWRLELSSAGNLVPGSIKVLAGEALRIDATAVTFRLQGRSGERVVVSFRTK